ncbi:PKD-like domain-containing protein [Pedobacter sp. NJ-S-72]
MKYCNQANTTSVVFTDNGTGSTYSWTNDHTEIGLPLSGTGQLPSFKALNTTNSPIVATITVTPVSLSGCAGAAKTFKITVNPTAVVDQLTSVKYCNQANTTPIVFTDNGTGSTYNWTNDHDEIGLPLSGTGEVPSFKAINNTNSPIVATIMVTPVSSEGCAGTAKTFTVTVNPTAVVDQPASVKYCNQAYTTAIVFTDNGTGSTYSWTNDHAEIGLSLSGTGQVPSFKALNNTNSPIVATITVTPVSLSGCAGAAKTFKITVNPTAVVDQPTNVKYCNQAVQQLRQCLQIMVLVVRTAGRMTMMKSAFLYRVPVRFRLLKL